MKYFFITLLLFLGTPFMSTAAELSFAVPEVVSGKPITVTVLLDTESESINSAEVVLSIPEGLLLSGYTQTTGAIAIWISKPHIAADGTIEFSGIIPGGVERLYDPENPQKRAIPLVNLDFVPTETMIEGEFRVIRSRILKNDGMGTSITTQSIPRFVSFKTNPTSTYRTGDETPPEPFTISIIESTFFARTPRLALFATTDAGSGVKEYKIKKGFGRYVIATSPYALPLTLWGSTLSMQAVDYEGNVREASIAIPGNRYLQGVVIGGMLFVGYFLYTYQRKRKKQV